MLKKVDLYQQLIQDDLSDDLKMLAEICGMDVVISLMKNYAGLQFYVPRISSFKNVYKRNIQNESKTISNKDLAAKYDVSEEYIRKIRQELRSEKLNGKV